MRPTARAVALLLAGAAAAPAVGAQESERRYLSGTDKDHTVPWEFTVSSGRRAGERATIPVPSNWELHGFGRYSYGRNVVPQETGHYRHRFTVPAGWRGRVVEIVFDGAMTDADVRVNGRSAGPVHQGGFYRFRHDVSRLVAYGAENVLEVAVSELSADTSVTRAERFGDYWTFGGIYRPVYLEAHPASHVARVALDARATGALRADVYLGGARAAGELRAQVVTLAGVPLGSAAVARVGAGDSVATLRTRVAGARPWSPEDPARYRLRVTLSRGGRAVHARTETFGFRTVELRAQDGIYVNGAKVRFKGVNRHSFWPSAGRTTSRAVSDGDVRLMKEMNMNAVRMSHYPPDEHFLDAADSAGLFVLDELAGWHNRYDTPVGRRLVRETVTRDVNHPSVIFWDNGNEGGWNPALDGEFARYDPQRRTVLHPWAVHGGVNASHYRAWSCCPGKGFRGRDVVLATEQLHALYDGGGGAGLDDYWELVLANPRAAGLFLWAFADESVVRTDRGGALDGDGNHAPDGIVGPYREQEGSYLAIKELWSPVRPELRDSDFLPPSFDGRLRVANHYHFTNLARVRFAWELVRFPGPGDGGTAHRVLQRGTPASPAAAPGESGTLHLGLPSDWRDADALLLTAVDPHGRTLYRWSWMVRSAAELARRVVREPPVRQPTAGATARDDGASITLEAAGVRVRIDRATGRLAAVERGGRTLALADGPRLVGPGGPAPALRAIRLTADGADQLVTATYGGPLHEVEWRMRPDGWLGLRYVYALHGEFDSFGVTFDYPDSLVTGLTWLGKGPYRVWKNRTHGAEFGVWHKAYNDTMTGLGWQYPEFKGYHGPFLWATLHTRELPLTVVSAGDDLFLRLLTPRAPPDSIGGVASDPQLATSTFPAGDLSFLHGIAPIGTKNRTPRELGPSGQPNYAFQRVPLQEQNDYVGELFLHFGDPAAAVTGRPAAAR